MAKNNGVTRRIDCELDKLIQEIARKNDINMRQASKEVAKMSREKIISKRREIRF